MITLNIRKRLANALRQSGNSDGAVTVFSADHARSLAILEFNSSSVFASMLDDNSFGSPPYFDNEDGGAEVLH